MRTPAGRIRNEMACSKPLPVMGLLLPGEAHIIQRPDEDSQRVNPQPQPIEPAGAPGLGVFDAAKIQLKKIDLG